MPPFNKLLSPSASRAILFDLSEVLIAGIIGIEQALAARLGCEATKVLVHFTGEDLDSLCRGSCPETHYLARVLDKSGWRLEPRDLAQMLRVNFARKIAGTEELLLRLSRIHELVLLSDHGREWIADIEALHPFLGLFRQRIYSYELGSLKREPITWQRVLQRLGRPAPECVFIDDSFTNIAVAASQGLDTILFASASALEAELTRRGLLTRQTTQVP